MPGRLATQARCKSDSCLGVRFQCVARRDCVTAIRICVCLVWGNNSINPIALSARVCARALLRCDAHNGNFECAVVLQAVQAMQAGSTMARTHTRQVCCLSHLFCDIQLPQSVLEFNTNSPLYLPLSLPHFSRCTSTPAAFTSISISFSFSLSCFFFPVFACANFGCISCLSALLCNWFELLFLSHAATYSKL